MRRRLGMLLAAAACAVRLAQPALAQPATAPASASASAPAPAPASALTSTSAPASGPARILAAAASPVDAPTAASAPAAAPHAPAPPGVLTGTLKKVRDTGVLTIGYRQASPPFSYADPKGRPIGFSIELCLAIADEARAELDDRDLQVRYVQVGAQDRLARVVDGTIDLECGVTTINAARRRQVAFSPIFFVSGTKLLARRDAGVRSVRDLRGRTVAVVQGTTNEAAIDAFRRRGALDVTVVPVASHEAAFSMVESGRADAWAGDDVLLYGFIAQAKSPRAFAVLGDYLSYDPYGIAYRRDDPDFDALVRATFEKLAASRELAHLYDRWLMQTLPFGRRAVGLPISAQLQSIYESLGLPPD